MKKAEKTREFIIEQAAPLFNSKGYSGTSLNDLIKATRLTKGAIYGNFSNKDEIAIAVYKYNVAGMSKKLDLVLDTKKTATEKLVAFTAFYKANWKALFEKGGCPVLNAAVEADDNLPFLRSAVQGSIKSWAKKIKMIIEEGKTNREFKKNIDSAQYAYTFITLIEGGVMLSKILNDKHFLFSALDRVNFIMEQEIFN
jgi:TetR/AcrR family transcriptional repressor of nem operon